MEQRLSSPPKAAMKDIGTDRQTDRYLQQTDYLLMIND